MARRAGIFFRLDLDLDIGIAGDWIFGGKPTQDYEGERVQSRGRNLVASGSS